MQKRIVFIGGPGSGKSTVAMDVACYLKKKGYNTELVTEWIRQDIQLHGPLTSITEQYRTRIKQQQIEDSIPNNVDWVITDSGTLTPYFYSALYADNSDSRQRLFLKDMFDFLMDDLYLKRYTHIFYLPSQYTYTKNKELLNDGTRFQTMEEVDKLDRLMRILLVEFHNPGNVHELNCTLSERKNKILEIIEA